MAAPLFFVRGPKGDIEGFETPKEAATWAEKHDGSIVTGKEAAGLQREADAQGAEGTAAAALGSSLFSVPKLLVGAIGSQEQKDFLRMSEEAHPYAAFGGAFLAPWGAASKLVGGAARGLFGLGEAADAASIFSRGASIFGEGSGLEAAALHSGEPAAGMAGRVAEARALEPAMEGLSKAARPGVAGELEGLAGRGFTPEGASIVEAHPRSFLEAAAREGSLNAGVGALNSAGDYLLQERYMDGDPHQDAGGLTDAILHGALTGGLLGGAAGVVTHGAGKAVDAALNPLNAPKVKVPAALRESLEERFRAGGMSAADAALAAKSAVEHGVAGVGAHADSYNIVSHLLENQRVKRGLETGEFQLPPSMAGEHDLADFMSNVGKKTHVVRGGGELPETATHLAGADADIAQALRDQKQTLIGASRKPLSAEAKAHYAANAYDGHLAQSSAEAELLEGGAEASRLIDKADAILAKNPTSRLGRIQALELLDKAEAAGPKGFSLEAERAAVRAPLEHPVNGDEFLSALDKHQLANKAREDLGALQKEAAAGGHMTHETAARLEQTMKSLGLESAGSVNKAVREHYENLAANAINNEQKALSPTMQMLGGLFAGGIASKVLGSFGGGFLGSKVAQTLGQAAIDPIGASATIRKATLMLRYGAADVDRLAQGLSANKEARGSLMNVAENVTPWGKVVWESAPGQTARLVGQTIENGFKALAPSMPQRAAAGLEIAHNIESHLKEHEPQPVVPKDVNPAAMANLPPRYNEREVANYQTRLQAILDPKGTVATFLKTGELSKEAADSLRVGHPQLVNTLVAKGAAEMAKAPAAERYAMGRQLEQLAGPNGGYFSPSSTPSFTAAVQKSYAQMQAGGPGPGGPSGNASPQAPPTAGGAQYAPVTAMKPNGFLRQTNAPPSAALSVSMGGAK